MKSPSRRPDRVGEMLRMAISQVILRGLRDPRIGLATVTEVKMSADLKKATVFVSVLGSRKTANRRCWASTGPRPTFAMKSAPN